MQLETRAIICGVHHHGEQGAVVRLLTPDHGLMVGYVRGARSRAVRPILIAANEVSARFAQRSADQMPSLIVELVFSRGPLLGEALAAAGLEWATVLAATTLAEGHPYPHLFSALDGVIRAIEAAPSARRWASALIQYEQLLLSTLGFGRAEDGVLSGEDWPALLAALSRTGDRIDRHLLGDRRTDPMAARHRLLDRLKRAAA
jgi:DNA repair protein RecO (recombination protein O)